jgi:peptidylprolyl isomerase
VPPARHLTPRRAVVALAAVGLLLAGCGSDEAADPGAKGVVKVEAGDAKTGPKVSVSNAPYKVTRTETKVLKEGTGTALTAEDIAKVNLVAVNGTNGKQLTSTWGKAPAALFLGQEDLLAGLRKGLLGAKPSSQVQISIPPADGFGQRGSSGMGVGADDTIVFVVDVLSGTKMLTEATGTAVPPKKGLPTVVFTKGKPATITSPKTAPPTTTVVQQLVTGTGEKVQAGQTVRVTYTGALWKDNSVFDSSASHDPGTFDFQVGAGSVIKAWDKGIVGQPVGSRVLLVVPPADGYGAAGSPPKISGTDTLVFVVDILAAY